MRWLHDTPGDGGLSPYEVLYGRSRPYAGVPLRSRTGWRMLWHFQEARLAGSKVGKGATRGASTQGGSGKQEKKRVASAEGGPKGVVVAAKRKDGRKAADVLDWALRGKRATGGA